MHKLLVLILSTVVILLLFNKSFAATPLEIISEGEYVMGAGETMEVAEERAKKSAMQKAAEKAGAFVKSYTKVNNLSLEADVIEVIANHAMKVDILEKKKSVLGDVEAIKFYVKIKAILTEEDVEANLKKVKEDQTIVDAYNRLRADYEKQDKEIANLKRQLELATGGDKQKIAKLISEEERKYKANLWVEKAQSLGLFADGALDAYKKALELNPEHPQAYFGIAKLISFNNFGEPESEKEVMKKVNALTEAVNNLDKAIQLDEGYAEAYALRAGILNDILKIRLYRLNEDNPVLEQQFHERIVNDINRAIALNAPDKAALYNLRASIYLEKAQSAEFEKASPDTIEEFFNQAVADIDQAISSCKETDLDCLNQYYSAKANVYSGIIYSYYLRNNNPIKADKAVSLSKYWRQKADEVAVKQAALSKEQDKFIGDFEATEYGKLEMEILNNRWVEKVIGSIKDLEGKSDEEREKIEEKKIKEIRTKVSSGKASAEDYLYLAMFMSDDSIETRKNNYAKGIMLFEKRKPKNKDALLLVHFYLSQAQFHLSNQQFDNALNVLTKAKTVVNKNLTNEEISKLMDLFKALQKPAEKNDEIKLLNRLKTLNKDDAETFWWLRFASDIVVLRAEIYEKLKLPSKAREEYRYLCEQLQDEKACKDVERLK